MFNLLNDFVQHKITIFETIKRIAILFGKIGDDEFLEEKNFIKNELNSYKDVSVPTFRKKELQFVGYVNENGFQKEIKNFDFKFHFKNIILDNNPSEVEKITLDEFIVLSIGKNVEFLEEYLGDSSKYITKKEVYEQLSYIVPEMNKSLPYDILELKPVVNEADLQGIIDEVSSNVLDILMKLENKYGAKKLNKLDAYGNNIIKVSEHWLSRHPWISMFIGLILGGAVSSLVNYFDADLKNFWNYIF